MFYKILDSKRRSILPIFKAFKKDFYLAGGTGIALQIGHRDSIDFDFFSKKEFDTKKLFINLKAIFKNHSLLKTQEDKNTLSILIDKEIRCSFFSYKYPLLNKTIDEENFRIASLEDIACMKCSAITSRASVKDYIDLYFLFKKIPIEKILQAITKKLPDLDINLVLKSLTYFDDVQMEPILFKDDHKVDFKTVKIFLKKTVQKVKWW